MQAMLAINSLTGRVGGLNLLHLIHGPTCWAMKIERVGHRQKSARVPEGLCGFKVCRAA
jgi:hypothetical protein